jgi:hypothetical protein
MYGEEEGELFLLRVVLPHEVREKYISMGEAQSVESMKVILGKAGVAPPNQKLWPKIVEYTMKWAHYLQSRDRAENVCRQMGWSQNSKSFIVGETEFYGNGKQRRAASSPLIRDVARLMKPKGDFQVWKDCINKLNQPELEMQAFGVFISFGSPLMRFTSTNGRSASQAYLAQPSLDRSLPHFPYGDRPSRSAFTNLQTTLLTAVLCPSRTL